MQHRLDAQRAVILSAASGLVAELGYSGCSIAEVASRSGVSTGTLYRYFPNKSELFAEVFREACSAEVAEVTLAAQAARDHKLCVCGQVAAVIETFSRRAVRAPQMAYALIAEPVDALVDAERNAFRASYRDVLAVALKAGIKAGQIPRQDATVTAAALVGAAAESLVLPLQLGTADATTISSLLDFTTRSIGGTHDNHPRSHQPGATARGSRRR